jgi:pimeloyl-ACP methyl ester carboxylesterase
MKIRRRIALDVLLVLFLVFATDAIASASDFEEVGEAHELKGAPGIYESTFAATVGKSPFDKIALHRVAKGPNPPAHPEAVVLYLPGTNMNGEVALEDPRYSFQVYLAEQGVDVWSMDYRTHFIPPETSQNDLSELQGWTSPIFEADISQAGMFIRQKTGRNKLFVAGFSRGVEFAYLYAAVHADKVQGIIALDGFIPNHPIRREPLPPGQYADDIGGKHLTYDKRYKLMQMVIENPDQPAPIPKYKTARENLEHVMYDAAPGNGAFANMPGGYSDAVVLAKLLIAYDRYWPSVQDGENLFVTLPGLLALLKASKIPVIAFASTNFGEDWPRQVEAASKSTGASDPSFTRLDNWGHLDVLAGTKSESQVFAPTVAWIKQHEK